MCPLRWLFATRTAPPAQLLLQQAKGLFTLLSVEILSFDFTGSECQIVRSPVAAPVFDAQDWMGDAPYFSSRMSIPLRPRRPQGLVTTRAVPLEPHPILPPPASQQIQDLGSRIPALT